MKLTREVKTDGTKKMKIVLIQNHGKQILEKGFPPFEKQVGVVSLEKIEDGTEFTLRVLDVSHLRYHYDPKTQKFELQFLSLKKELEGDGD